MIAVMLLYIKSALSRNKTVAAGNSGAREYPGTLSKRLVVRKFRLPKPAVILPGSAGKTFRVRRIPIEKGVLR
ncbi:MAG TPA: hypothetical protein GXX34_08310 [Clostridia bacterium]|nr:hypothetical protein [Clostridia bacterium]